MIGTDSRSARYTRSHRARCAILSLRPPSSVMFPEVNLSHRRRMVSAQDLGGRLDQLACLFAAHVGKRPYLGSLASPSARRPHRPWHPPERTAGTRTPCWPLFEGAALPN